MRASLSRPNSPIQPARPLSLSLILRLNHRFGLRATQLEKGR
jgi:hypothetical protein